MLGTRGADVALQIAETLAALKLPASLAPAIGGFALQDVIEHAELGYTDDWEEFGRAARELPRDRHVRLHCSIDCRRSAGAGGRVPVLAGGGGIRGIQGSGGSGSREPGAGSREPSGAGIRGPGAGMESGIWDE